jgi:hypothetical protein
MRKNYGVSELGSAKPIGLSPVPHPWCVKSNSDKEDLVVFLLTL